MKNIKEMILNTGESISYDEDVLQDRIEYAKHIQELVSILVLMDLCIKTRPFTCRI